MKNGDHLFLVDGSGYIFRAYHALPPLTRKSDGLPVGAVAGFCNMLWKLLCEARDTSVGVAPTHFAVIFDYSSKTFRNELYDGYKANRTAPPDDLIPQFALIRQATCAFNLPCIEKEGYEADDLIATYARLAEAAGGDVTIVSSDKDLMQLVTERVAMYDSMKDKRISISEVVEKWGVAPDKMIDLQAMTGDSTDNVPGIPGIGPKTAAQLLTEFGDLDTLLERAGEIRQNKRRENIIEFADQARLSRELVTLRNDVPLDFDLEALQLEPQDGPKLIAFLKGLEFNSLTRRVAERTETDAAAVEPEPIKTEQGATAHGPDLDAGDLAPSLAAAGEAAAPRDGGIAGLSVRTIGWRPDELAKNRIAAAARGRIDHSAYITIRDMETLKAWVAQAQDSGLVAFDTETNSLDPMRADLVGISLALADNAHDASGTGIVAGYVPLAHRLGAEDLLGGGPAPDQIPFGEALPVLKELLEDASVLKVVQNAKYTLQVLKRHGVELKSFDDTMLISYALDAGKGNHGMDNLAERWLSHKPIAYKDVCGSGKAAITFDLADIEKATAYAAENTDVTLRLWLALKPRLVAENLVTVYERLERPLVAVLVRMEERGISVDRQILSRLSGELAQGAAALEAEIQELAGESFNIGSPKQLGDILFGKMGLPGGAKTKGGQWSTSAQVL
ncbi:MAG TPA: DNA polymerase, partial [Pararhizobium sp.]|nr:DNA polymerase [Pararhizobium sp.]